jgi:hypothetical protein
MVARLPGLLTHLDRARLEPTFPPPRHNLHPDFGLAFTLAFFFLTMGFGAAVSARLRGTSEPRSRFADMVRIGGYRSKTDPWAFMLIFLVIMLAFFIGDERPAGTPKLSRSVDFLVGWIIAFGAMLGLYVGRYASFYRVRRLAITVIAILGVSLAMTH